MKSVTYWHILKQYHRELYKSKLYWASGLLILLSFAALAARCIKTTIVLLVIGIILLVISKISLLNHKIKK